MASLTLRRYRDWETKDALNAIDKEYNFKLEQAKGNATIEAALEKEKSDKIEKIQREAFEQDKQAKEIEYQEKIKDALNFVWLKSIV